MSRLRLPLFFLTLILVVLATGCGGSTKHPATTPRCTPSDFAMQCIRGRITAAIPPAAAAPVLAYGVDFAWGAPSPAWIHRAGGVFGASYYSFDPGKNWTLARVNAFHAAGLKTVGVWETTANRALAGFSAGRSDARAAAAQAAAVGEPSNRPVYFAVDFDSSLNPTAILPYFQGVASALGKARIGAYGGLATIRVLFNSGLITYGWQTAAWSFGVWDTRAQLQQYGFGATLDWDRALAADYGQWPLIPAPKPPPADTYAVFARGPFPSQWGPLSERRTVMQFDGALKHKSRYVGYITRVLQPKLRFLANRAAYIALVLHHGWKRDHLGPRYQFLIHRADRRL